MKIQKIETLFVNQQSFKANKHDKNYNNKNNTKIFYDIDSVDEALLTDSIDDPILPQIVRKFRNAYGVLFPVKTIEEAKKIKNQIDELVEDHKFQVVA